MARNDHVEMTFLVVGTHRCGKTALVRRMCDGAWADQVSPTIGLDDSAGSCVVKPEGDRLRDDLHILVPDSGIKVRFIEIGGRDFNLRSAPRGQNINGILLCFDLGDRSSFRTAAHILMKHRADRHFAHERAAVASCMDSSPRLAVVLCGVKADAADENGGHSVSISEQLDFVTQSNIDGTFVTSAKTGEGAKEAFQALLLAALEADEEAQSSRILAKKGPPISETWSLLSRGTGCELQGLQSEISPAAGKSLPTMTSPRGLRPHEPPRGALAAQVVEVLDNRGEAYGARPLSTCLERGLLHRVVHVWLCDPRIGGFLLRRYSPTSAKWPRKWAPTASGEVLSYSEATHQAVGFSGPQNAELSSDAARRVLREQLGITYSSGIEHWFSCTSSVGNLRELQEVYAVDVELNGLADLQIRSDEALEWVHFNDVFGSEGAKASRLFHIEDKYRVAIVLKMRSRILYSHSQNEAADPTKLGQSWLDCPMPVPSTKQTEEPTEIDCH